MMLIPQFPGTASPVATPKTHQDLMAVTARRDELRSQLQSLSEQRGELADQVGRLSSDPAVRNGPVARLKALDDRIGRVERDVQASDEAIAQAKANGVSGDEPTVINLPDVSAPPPSFPMIPGPSEWYMQQMPWRERVLNSLEVTAPITLATVVLLGALLYWRISRSVKNQFNSLLSMQQLQLQELQRSVDTVAVEIERVSENQRFVTKLVGERPVERTPHAPRTTPH